VCAKCIGEPYLAASAIISAQGGLNVTVDLKALARLGAQARIADLIAEIDAILKAFPNLGEAAARPGQQGVQAEVKPVVPRRKRSRMSAAARKAVSERMKRYWAQRRKAKKGR
jgi:phosphopantothenate synthetase